MGFQPTEVPSEVRDKISLAEEGGKLKDPMMGLSTFLSSFMVPGMAGFTPKERLSPALAAAGRQGRTLVYKELKSRIPEDDGGLLNGLRRNIMNMFRESVDKELTRKEHIDQYSNAVRELTALPDELTKGIREVKKLKGVSRAGEYGGGELGLASNFGEGVIPHEIAGHGGVDLARSLKLKSLRDKKLADTISNLPKKDQKTLENLRIASDFEYSNYSKPGKTSAENKEMLSFYNKNYDIWPTELVSNGVAPKIVPHAEKTGSRLSTYDWLKLVRDPAEKGLQSMKKNFKSDYEMLRDYTK